MADTAAHLVDRVLPEVPVRQWVLLLPFALRYRLAYDATLASTALGVFVRTVFASLGRRARRQWSVRDGQCGAVTFVQRFGDALNLNVHFHSLVPDGVYAPGPDGALRFRPLAPPDDAEIGRVARQVARRLVRLLERHSLGPDADSPDADPLASLENCPSFPYPSVRSPIRRGAPRCSAIAACGSLPSPTVAPCGSRVCSSCGSRRETPGSAGPPGVSQRW